MEEVRVSATFAAFGVTGKHTRNLSSMRFLVMLTRVPRIKIVEQLTSKN